MNFLRVTNDFYVFYSFKKLDCCNAIKKSLQTLEGFFFGGVDIEVGFHSGDIDHFFDWGLEFAEQKFQLETFQHLR